MMKINIGLFFGLFFMIPFLNGQELKTELIHRLRVQDCGFELKKVGSTSFLEQKKQNFNPNWPGGLNRGMALNLTGLGCIDNYPSAGVGAELGATHITNFGITTNGYIGGASNETMWVGFSAGYTHGLTKIAPYGLIGGAFILSGIEAAIVGTLELGTNFRLTGWLSVKPALRIALGKFEGETKLYNHNVLMVSIVLDPFRLLPYYY